MDYAALKTELTNDPASLGYKAQGQGLDKLAALLNTPGPALAPPQSWTKQEQFIPLTTVLMWAAKTGVRAKLEAAATDTTSPVRSIALAVRDLLGGNLGPLDCMSADNLAMMDGLIAAGVMASGDKASLLALANSPATRGEFLGLVAAGGQVTPRMVNTALNVASDEWVNYE